MRNWFVFGTLLLLASLAARPAARADGPLPLDESAAAMTLPEGFKATLFAGEPDVHQPIAFTIDPRGRLWVVECYAYPLWLGGPEGRDRVLILEDTDHDGRHDRRTVFYEGGTNLTGIALGFGGVWLCSTPNLLFIPERDGDDRPDGPPEVVLDGWDVKAQHNMVNGLRWGPDGWLWGLNGILSNSNVGRPGTPQEQRTPINCGVWRYHPTRQVFEAVAHGTTNPWGLDFDALGEAFITNCVIPHLFHAVPGARFQRMFGQDFNPNSYELMPTCADHVHWDTVEAWSDIRRKGVTPTTDRAGGGHAHVGAMIYLGDNWPEPFRGGAFTCNIHGHRVNHDALERSRSGYVARHQRDFLMANDSWFRGLELKYGPDGAVYLTDWSDTGECHENDADGSHRENGRIYRITFGDAPARPVDLAALDDMKLVECLSHRNEWYVRTARRLLQERAAAGRDLSTTIEPLRRLLGSDQDELALRSLWTLHAIGQADAAILLGLLDHPSEHRRAWAVRLLADGPRLDQSALDRLTKMARDDAAPKVRLALAAALQRLPVAERWGIAEGLAAHAEDADDTPLTLMIWYGMEPLVPADPSRAAALAQSTAIPKLQRFLARRLVGHDLAAGLAALMDALQHAPDSNRREVLAGIHEALRGRKSVAAPAGWPELSAQLLRSGDPLVRESTAMVGLIFGEKAAADALARTAAAPGDDAAARRRALEALAERRATGTSALALGLLDDPDVRATAIRVLSAFNDPAAPRALIDRYQQLAPAEREDILATLTSRPSFAGELLDAIQREVVPRKDITATTARQILAMKDADLTALLEKLWGTIRPTAANKTELIARYKGILGDESAPLPDARRGRNVFEKTCQQCHRLYALGGEVGPELTGSDRASADYILENVLDPSAAVARDYQLIQVVTTDGRLLSGIIKAQNDASLEVQTVNERIVLPREDIEMMQTLNTSMMPEGLLEGLSSQDLRDLFSYLASSAQVEPAAR